MVNLAASSHKYRHSNRSKFYVEKFTDFLKVTYFFVSVLKYTLEKRMLLVTKYQSKYATKYMNSFKKLIQIISAKFQYKALSIPVNAYVNTCAKCGIGKVTRWFIVKFLNRKVGVSHF